MVQDADIKRLVSNLGYITLALLQHVMHVKFYHIAIHHICKICDVFY
jgi:hypothetical protein